MLAPGANPDDVRMRITGAEAMRVDEHGNLVLEAAAGQVIQRRPAIYQTRKGVRSAVDGRYRILAGNRVEFDLAKYDRRLPLWIDPVLSYATYLGGAGNDTPNAIAVDSGGSVYIAGYTQSVGFPATANAFQGALKAGFGDTDAFVTKLSVDGKSVVFSTYLGGSAFDSANAIAVDATGIYVAGETASANFPTTAGVVQPVTAGGGDAFVAKSNLAGTSLVYSSYFGGGCNDRAKALAVDGSGNVVIAGFTCAVDFPTSPGAFQKTKSGSWSGFVAKLNPAATSTLFSTYLGGSTADYVMAVALNPSSGSTYVTGQTQSSDFPVTPGVVQPIYRGVEDAFVTELNADGSGLVYSTYLGGSADDVGNSIALDSTATRMSPDRPLRSTSPLRRDPTNRHFSLIRIHLLPG